MCLAGLNAGAIHHDNGHFTLKEARFLDNDANYDFSAVQSSATSSISHTSIAAPLSSRTSKTIVRASEDSQLVALRVSCGEGQRVAHHANTSVFLCTPCESQQSYLFGSEYGIWAQPDGTLRTCSPCPSKGMSCLGGTNIIANAGFAAQLINSTGPTGIVSTRVSPVACPRLASCEGLRPVNISLSTLCATGYEGTDSFIISLYAS